MVSLGKPTLTWSPTHSVSCFSSINQETKFCIRTIEKTNRCQRLTYKMIADNRERKLAICQEIVDGKWSNWTDLGDCKGLQQVENYSCGPGYQHRERKCARTLGGKFCQVDGEDYEGRTMRISVECNSGDCPG